MNDLYYNKRILITGSSGFIAWNIINWLSKINCTIVCFTRKVNETKEKNSKAKIEYIEGSYQDETLYENAVKNIDIIFHLAAQTSVYVAESNPVEDSQANVRPMQLLLEACKKVGKCPTIVFAGTSTQCGLPSKLPVGEYQVDKPITMYDLNKLQTENYLKYYTYMGWVKGVSLRLTNVYGPGPRSSSIDRGILNLMIFNGLCGKDLTIYGKGDCIRDYIYIDDVVTAFLSAAVNVNEILGKHYVLGSGIGTKIYDAIHLVGQLVTDYTNKQVKVRCIEAPKGLLEIESRNFVADITSLKKNINYRIKYNLNDGIKYTIMSNSKSWDHKA